MHQRPPGHGPRAIHSLGRRGPRDPTPCLGRGQLPLPLGPDLLLPTRQFVRGRDCRFDLRLLVGKALPDYQQWKDGEAESNWRDLITASIEEHLVAIRHAEESPVSREARKVEEQAIALEIVSNYPSRDERLRVWIERTGKSERAFYLRLAETW
jgi:hypothetical protein